jgi:hypothetical protein
MWSAVIGTISVPVLLITYYNSHLIAGLPIFNEKNGFRATFDRLMSPSQSAGIVTGEGLDRAAQIARLRSMTAGPEMTTGAATRVNFVAIAFDEKPEPTSSSKTASRHIVDRDGYRRMTLDLGQLPREALVVIADQPIRWTVTAANSAWGLIGFEGLAPFDIVNGRAGMLAGYRIAAFGARETASASDPFHADQRRRRNLCASVRAWTEHFGAAVNQTAFALVSNPTTIGSSAGGITSDGPARVSWTGPTVESLCKQR